MTPERNTSLVEQSEVSSLDNTIGFMADLDRFVKDISAALKRHGEDLGDGRFRAPASTIDNRLDYTNDRRLDALEAALEAEGLSPEGAERIRDEVEAILEYDPRFQIDGASASEPRELAAAIVANIEHRAADLIEESHVTSSSLHAQPTLSVDRLAARPSTSSPTAKTQVTSTTNEAASPQSCPSNTGSSRGALQLRSRIRRGCLLPRPSYEQPLN